MQNCTHRSAQQGNTQGNLHTAAHFGPLPTSCTSTARNLGITLPASTTRFRRQQGSRWSVRDFVEDLPHQAITRVFASYTHHLSDSAPDWHLRLRHTRYNSCTSVIFRSVYHPCGNWIKYAMLEGSTRMPRQPHAENVPPQRCREALMCARWLLSANGARLPCGPFQFWRPSLGL